MSEVDAEDIPNSDDSAFVAEEDDQQEHVSEENDADLGVDEDGVTTLPSNVYVATSQGLLTAEQLHEAGIKTTHIVIHDQTLDDLKTPTTPLPPPTPATPHSRERGIRYQWDDSAFNEILPVRCKSSNGELHKNKFGSGGRGRCIKMGENWYTPSEFEAVCGRASSKDWKRSIRYGGRTLSCLIEDGVLQPHATSCTCAACCDDESVTGPVRLFVPYKRRKRDSSSEGLPRKKSLSSKSGSSPSPIKDNSTMAVLPVGNGSLGNSLGSLPVRITTSETGGTIQIIAADPGCSLVGEQTMMLAAPPHHVKQVPSGSSSNSSLSELNVNEQKVWWQLEEMANNLLLQAQQLKNLVEQAKQQSQSGRENFIRSIKDHYEKEKIEALNSLRIEAQVQLSRALMEERTQKDIAVQQALAQARAEMQDVTTVLQASEDKATGTVTLSWPTPATQQHHQQQQQQQHHIVHHHQQQQQQLPNNVVIKTLMDEADDSDRERE